jgi:hypothetical protein
MKGGGRVLPWLGSLGSSCRYKRILSRLGCSSRPITNYFFLHYTLVHFIFSSLPRKLGRQSCRVTCLLICVSGSGTFQENFIKPIDEERKQSTFVISHEKKLHDFLCSPVPRPVPNCTAVHYFMLSMLAGSEFTVHNWLPNQNKQREGDGDSKR